MRGYDFSPYRRSTVGFDRLFDFLENASRAEQDNYPALRHREAERRQLPDHARRGRLQAGRDRHHRPPEHADDQRPPRRGARQGRQFPAHGHRHPRLRAQASSSPISSGSTGAEHERRPARDRAGPRDPRGDEAAQDRDRRRGAGDDRGGKRRRRPAEASEPSMPAPMRSGAGCSAPGFAPAPDWLASSGFV